MQQKIYRAAKVLAKLGVLMIALLSFLGAFAVAMTQYSPFRKWAIDQGLDAANKALAGNLSVEEIEGNFLTGLTIKNAYLNAADTPLAVIPRISLQYHLIPFFEAKTIQASVIFHNPELYLHRDQDGIWNFTQIAQPPEEEEDKPRQPLEWIFDIQNLEIRDGVVEFNDETTLPFNSENNRLNLLGSRLYRFNLALGGWISETEQQIDVEHLSFLIDDVDLSLVELSAGIAVDDKGLHIDGLHIETERSYLELNLSIDSVDIFDSTLATSWRGYPFSVRMSGKRVDTRELITLLPSLGFLGGVIGVDLEASGVFSDILVNRVDLELERSRLTGKARLRDIDNSVRSRIDAEFTDSRLFYSDASVHIPGISIPDLSYLAEVEVEKLTYSGTSRDFVSLFDLSSAVGRIRGGGGMNFSDFPVWRVDAVVEEVNPGPLLGSDEYEGKVSARLVAEGQGFTPEAMSSRFRLIGGSSQVGPRTIERLWVDGSFGNGGILSLDTAMIAWGNETQSYIPEMIGLDPLEQLLQDQRIQPMTGSFAERLVFSEADAAVIDGLPSLRASGWYDVRESGLPKYRGAVETDRLNLADITLNPEHETELGLTLVVEGIGLEPDLMDGTARLRVTDAVLPSGVALRPFGVDVTLHRNENERHLALNSDFLDARVEGIWRFESLLPALTGGFKKLVNYISRKGTYSSDEFDFILADDFEIEPILVEYEFMPRDLSLLKAFIQGTTIQMDASLKGTITGTSQLLGITARGEINEFNYENGDQDVKFGGTTVDAEIWNISSGSMDDLLDAEIALRSDSLIYVNDLRIALPHLDLSFRDGLLTANGATMIDNTYSVALDGKIDVLDDRGYAVAMDTLIVGWSRGLKWRNIDPVRFVLADEKVDIESFRLVREGAELISITGEFLDYNRFDELRVSVTGTSLEALQPFIVDPKTLEMLETLSGSLQDLDVVVNGTLDAPKIKGHLNVDGLKYTNIQIGDLELDIDYRDQNLTGKVRILRPLTIDALSNVSLATVKIESFPIDLAMASRDERIITGKPVLITAQTKELPLAIVGPFTPSLVIQRGTANLDFTLKGSYPRLTYSGNGRINDGIMTVETTNISYIANGKFEFRENRVDITGVVLNNLPSDYPRGVARANGSIRFDGFIPELFDVNIRTGDEGLLVLSDATQTVNDAYYGDLVVATQENILHFGGSYAEPTLTGEIVVLNSSLKYPYRETSAAFVDHVEFTEYDEWVSQREKQYGPILSDEQLKENEIKAPDELKGADADSIQPDGLAKTVDQMQRQSDAGISKPIPRGTFADRLRTDLRISLESGATIIVEIGPLQELRLNLVNDGLPLDFKMKGRDMSLRGTVRLVEGSKFIYLKTFDARGTVSFEEDIENPSFDISGVCQGRHTSTNESFTVTARLTGTREKPELDFSYSIGGVTAVDDKERVLANASALLLTGRRISEVEGGAIGVLFENALQDFSSAAVSVLLDDIFSDFGVDINLGNSVDPAEAEVNVVRQLSEILFRYDAKVRSPESGTISIEIPISVLIDPIKLNNLVLELQREVLDKFESGGTGPTTTEGEDIFRLRIGLKETW
ncbi:MAG: translocation/assembly module TamB domain-containing protein [Chlorobi bacterium]|nr:translocation/assembly module TamB domain-containing protein [Chlorobiota bacterium]